MVKSIEDEYVCKICESSKVAYYYADNNKDISKIAENVLYSIINKVNSTNNFSSSKKVEYLEELIENNIKEYLYFYSKEELVIGLLNLKSYYRHLVSLNGIKIQDYENVNRHSEILLMISVLLKIDSRKFKGNKLINQIEYLAIAFRLVYFYNVIKDNIEKYRYLEQSNQNIHIRDISIFIKEGAFYSDEYNQYMDSMLNMSAIDIPEDSIVNSDLLKKLLDKEKIGKKFLVKELSNILLSELKLSLEDLSNLVKLGIAKDKTMFLVIESKENLIKGLNCESDGIENLINIFSLNKLNLDELDDLRNIELRSIYEVDNNIIFPMFDMMYNSACFEQFLLKKHFEEYYLKYLDDGIKESVKNKLKNIESKISTYLSYIILDKLIINNYKVPNAKNGPIAEINSIVIKKNNKTINILKNGRDYGDIDVLALDEKNKQILNIELKHFKPLIEMNELNDRYKITDRQKYIKKARTREKILQDNIEDVVEFLKGDKSLKYKVRTIIVSPRPDYWLMKDNSIEYLSWFDIIQKIENKCL